MLSFYFHLPSDEPGAPAVCGISNHSQSWFATGRTALA